MNLDPDSLNLDDIQDAMDTLDKEQSTLSPDDPTNLPRLREIQSCKNQLVREIVRYHKKTKNMNHGKKEKTLSVNVDMEEPEPGNSTDYLNTHSIEDETPVEKKSQLRSLIERQAYVQAAILDLKEKTANSPNDSPSIPANDGFVTQSKKRKSSTQISTAHAKAFIIPTGNAFEALADNSPEELVPVDEETASNDNLENSASQPMTVDPVQKPRRVPPIIINQAVDWRVLSKSLKEIATEDFTGKLNSQIIKIQPKNPTDYRKISSFLSDSKIEYHSYRLPEDKTLKVIIRGIPDNITTDDILNELHFLNFPVKSVAQLRGSRSKKPLPLYLIDLENSPAGREIFNLKTVFYLRVIIESYRRRKGPTQCFTCQRLGHVQNSCHNKPNCVKCAGQHHTRECKKTLETPPKCINCGGAHTANYRLCPTFVKFTEKSLPPPTTKDSQIRTGVSYRDALSGNKPSSPPPPIQDLNPPTQNHPDQFNFNVKTLLDLLPLIKEIGIEEVKNLIILLNAYPGSLSSQLPNTLAGLSKP